jgi:hypothetical protein
MEYGLSSAAGTLHSLRGLATLIFQHCPLFYCKVVRDLNANVATMGDGVRGRLGRSAAVAKL